jgi:hypothetical protein
MLSHQGVTRRAGDRHDARTPRLLRDDPTHRDDRRHPPHPSGYTRGSRQLGARTHQVVAGDALRSADLERRCLVHRRRLAERDHVPARLDDTRVRDGDAELACVIIGTQSPGEAPLASTGFFELWFASGKPGANGHELTLDAARPRANRTMSVTDFGDAPVLLLNV